MFTQNGEAALHAAALFGKAAVVKALVQAGAQPHIKNKVIEFSCGVTNPIVIGMYLNYFLFVYIIFLVLHVLSSYYAILGWSDPWWCG